jgi:hypothetical protein
MAENLGGRAEIMTPIELKARLAVLGRSAFPFMKNPSLLGSSS